MRLLFSFARHKTLLMTVRTNGMSPCFCYFLQFFRFRELINLNCNDLEIDESYMDVVIRKSKTDQLRLGNHSVSARTGSARCGRSLVYTPQGRDS